MKIIGQSLFIAIVALGGGFAASASAIYYDRASWEAIVIGETVIDFEGLAAPGGFVDYSTQPPGLTIAGVNFTSPSDSGNSPAGIFVIDPGFDTFADWGSGAILDAQQGVPTRILATIAAGVTAMGAELFSPAAITPPDFLLTLSTGESFTVSTAAQPQRTFIGFTSAVPITWIAFTPQSSGSDSALDNFSFGTAVGTAVPEPGQFAGVWLSLAAIGFWKRFRRAA